VVVTIVIKLQIAANNKLIKVANIVGSRSHAAGIEPGLNLTTLGVCANFSIERSESVFLNTKAIII
jgi:hypothetical protein